MFGSNIADHGVFHLASLLSSQSPGAVMPTPRVTFHRIAVIALLLIMAGTILHTIHGESLTWDEGDHIFSGYEIWKTHDYGYNPEHPPIVKMLATIPLLGLNLKVPPDQHRFFKTEAYLDGRELLFRSPGYNGQDLTFRVRVLPMLFTLIAAILVYCAGREMFSCTTGLVALVLFTFDPTLLAHGAFVTTDMAATCTIFATCYALWRWYQKPTWPRAAVAGIAAGIALGAKHSTVLLAPMLVALAAGMLIAHYRNREISSPGALKTLGALATIVGIAVFLLWSFYGFRYNARPAPLALSPSLIDYAAPLGGFETKGILLAGRLKLLPESYLYGLTDVRAMANGMPSYFMGKVYQHGVWQYFPVLILIKYTLGMLGLLLLTTYAIARRWLHNWSALYFLIAPPAIYLFVAMTSHLNIGARHILPISIFACVLAAAGAVTLAQRSRGWAITVTILVALHVVTSLHAAPNYMAYANEAWGGPTQTYKYLSDSNTDWAQQLVATSAYLREHNIHDCYIAYFAATAILPSDYGIPCKLLPTPDATSFGDFIDVPPVIHGTVLISAGTINGFETGSRVLNPFESFRSLQPIDSIQHGIFVFNGTFSIPLASALAPIARSAEFLKQNNPEAAVREAQIAVQLAPNDLQPQLALGDALAAQHQSQQALRAYQTAATVIDTMEPDARKEWHETLQKKIDALK